MEGNTPIELLVSRVWSGTKWHYPNIERMVEENNRLRAELVAAIKERDELRCEVCDWVGNHFKEPPQDVAKRNGWDCFDTGVWDCYKEVTDDR